MLAEIGHENLFEENTQNQGTYIPILSIDQNNKLENILIFQSQQK